MEDRMQLVWVWCAALGLAAGHEDALYYAPQTFALAQAPRAMFQPARAAASPRGARRMAPQRGGGRAPLFRAAGEGATDAAGEGATDAAAQGTIAPSSWNTDERQYDNSNSYSRGAEERRPEPWRPPYGAGKEQKAAILHHKQSLSSEGAFRFEYAADSGLAAGEQIEPDGSRVGAYQYRDPSGRLVSLKYRAGKQGFQILEGSHLPKSPEPVAPPAQTDDYYSSAYEQQRQQYELQQQYNTQRPQQQQQQQQQWQQEGRGAERAGGSPQGFSADSWAPGGRDDGQYRDNDTEEQSRGGPHSFGAGYAFAFKG